MSAREIHFTLYNCTSHPLSLDNSKTTLDHGEWVTNPPSNIGPGSPSNPTQAYFRADSDGFMTGAQFSVTYNIEGNQESGSLTASADDPYGGSNTCSITFNGVKMHTDHYDSSKNPPDQYHDGGNTCYPTFYIYEGPGS